MHTLARLPGYFPFPGPEEEQAISKTLSEIPCLTVIFGASSYHFSLPLPPLEFALMGSVGKTAQLRYILTEPQFHAVR